MDATIKPRTWQYRFSAGQWGAAGSFPGQHGPPTACVPISVPSLWGSFSLHAAAAVRVHKVKMAEVGVYADSPVRSKRVILIHVAARVG